MADIWAKNNDTGAVARVPEGALPALAGSGWAKCTKAESAEQEKRLQAERAERVASLTPATTDAAAADTATTTAPESRPADTEKESA